MNDSFDIKFKKTKGIDLEVITKNIASNKKKGLFKIIGAVLVSSSKYRIARSKKTPDNEPWSNWNSEAYRQKQNKKKRVERKNILRDTGRLMSSITYEADSNGVAVGTNTIYAGTMFFGNSKLNIVGRQALGVSKEDKEDISDVITKFMTRV